jgi:anti-sigma B factor antagonist
MEINIAERNRVNVVSIVGKIDASNAGRVSVALDNLVNEGKVLLVGDFDRVDYISSAGLRVILAALKSARNQKGDFCLANVKDNVDTVLEYSGFKRLIKLFRDVDSAITALS